ncbi:MAG: histidine phosphatase family protein [Pirellulales bacterium]|nr:histidine phosphatase family protein [Pirellulales bacterium]
MVQLILIRPGCTEYDQQARIQGRLDIPLSEAGRKEAWAASESLRAYLPKALYFASCRNAEETAEVVGEALKLKPRAIEELQNLDQGLWQGMLIDEIRHKQPKVFKQWQEHPETVCPPQGESLADATERVEYALEKLARRHRHGAIVLVAPEPLASVILHRLTGEEIGDLWHAENGCGRIEVLHLDRNLAAVGAAGLTDGHPNGHSNDFGAHVNGSTAISRN